MGLIRLEFDPGPGKIELTVEILRARTVQNKPKLLDQVRDVIRRKHFGIRTEQADRNRTSEVRGHKSEHRGQSLYCSMSILLSRNSRTKAIPSKGRRSVWIIPSRKPARLNACDLEVAVNAWIRACGSCEVVSS